MADYYFKMDDMAVGYQGKTLIHDQMDPVNLQF